MQAHEGELTCPISKCFFPFCQAIEKNLNPPPTQYFASQKIHCPKCLYKNHSNGNTTYYHQVLAAAIVCPGIKQVIPFAPEPIQNTDGTTKQDCEINAGKRLLKKIRADHSRLKITIGGDSLYSKQPFINELKANNMSFILGAKPADHKNLYQWFNETRAINETHTLKIKDLNGKVHVYEWLNEIPLNDENGELPISGKMVSDIKW